MRPILGRDRAVRLFVGLARKYGPGRVRWSRRIMVNGLPGLLSRDQSGTLQTYALEVGAEGVVSVYVTRNPDKLAHLLALTPA